MACILVEALGRRSARVEPCHLNSIEYLLNIYIEYVTYVEELAFRASQLEFRPCKDLIKAVSDSDALLLMVSCCIMGRPWAPVS